LLPTAVVQGEGSPQGFAARGNTEGGGIADCGASLASTRENVKALEHTLGLAL